jgi:hypothetical protein
LEINHRPKGTIRSIRKIRGQKMNDQPKPFRAFRLFRGQKLNAQPKPGRCA